MLSKTFAVMFIVSFFSAVLTGNVQRMAGEFATSLSDAVSLCISLLGMMCFWSGLMKVLQEAGVLKYLTKVLSPVLKLIYGKSICSRKNLENLSSSVSANFLCLGNAALPLGIKTVKEFEKNNKSGAATDGTIMFAVLNTVPFQLLPSTLIALRTKHSSADPFDVVPYIWLCSVVITAFAVFVCKILSKIWRDKG